MAALEVSEILDDDIDAVSALWERCGLTRPWNDPRRDIAFARGSSNATLLVGRRGRQILASVLAVHDGHRGTVYYVSVDPGARGMGYGRIMMEAAEEWLREQGVWKLNLQVRADNIAVTAFYTALGYGREERVNLSKWLDPTRKPGDEA